MISKIDLLKFRGNQSTIFTGRPQGMKARSELDLDSVDKDPNSSVVFIIPEKTTSFNPSFYLGLLYHSFKNLGIVEFDKKYQFEINISDPETAEVISKNLNDGKRNAINELNNKTGLWKFIKNSQ